MEKKTGARALRSIIEDYMLDIMYEIPKDNNIGKVVITGDYILKNNNYYVNDEEKVYLTMHIQRVINVAREKDK